jgi:hypothetical protein
MEQISSNFKMAEFRVSVTTTAAGIPNGIPEDVKPAIQALVLNLLQPICDATGWRCKINSGYRSPEVNRRVGGVATSQHVKGEAADCVFLPKDIKVLPIDVLRVVTELGLDFDQMIAYNGFVHLSYTTKRANRRQILYNKSYTGVRL